MSEVQRHRHARRRHTLILSDVHLSQAHPEDPADPLWMRYRRREHHPDSDFAAMVDHLLATTTDDDAIELVFNGDVLDFDAPWVKDGQSSFDELPSTEAGCLVQVKLLLADHVVWFSAVARLLLAGHRLLIVSGNHDVELYWPAVRSTIRQELLRLCTVEAARAIDDDEASDIDSRVRFRAWFHVTEDRIYIEHGSQYDILNGVRHAMIPLTRERDRIHPMCGKLAFRRTGSRMGYFNPYYEETFYLGFFGYLNHFLRFYAFSRKSIGRVWFVGAVRSVLEIFRHRHRDERLDEGRTLAQAETGATPEAIDATHALRVRPAEDTMLPILRELWLDRIFLFFGMVLVLAVIAVLAPWKTAGIALGVMLGLFVIYELVTPKPDLRTYDQAPPTVLEIFDIHGVRAICMGHTHRPFSRWIDGKFHGNSGSWCPAFRDIECTQPQLDGRPVLMLTARDGSLHGGLHWFRDGALVPDAEGCVSGKMEIVSEKTGEGVSVGV